MGMGTGVHLLSLARRLSWRSTQHVLTLFLCGLFVSASIQAQERSDAEDFAPNGIELFLGATLHDGDAETSLGLAYERRIRQEFGVGVMAEFTKGREWVLAVPFSWHVTESWKVEFAAGAELAPDDDDEFLARIGASYEFGFSGWSLAPELNVDFAGGEVKTVLGISFGWEFR
jgi:hypothetical protein